MCDEPKVQRIVDRLFKITLRSPLGTIAIPSISIERRDLLRLPSDLTNPCICCKEWSQFITKSLFADDKKKKKKRNDVNIERWSEKLQATEFLLGLNRKLELCVQKDLDPSTKEFSGQVIDCVEEAIAWMKKPRALHESFAPFEGYGDPMLYLPPGEEKELDISKMEEQLIGSLWKYCAVKSNIIVFRENFKELLKVSFNVDECLYDHTQEEMMSPGKVLEEMDIYNEESMALGEKFEQKYKGMMAKRFESSLQFVEEIKKSEMKRLQLVTLTRAEDFEGVNAASLYVDFNTRHEAALKSLLDVWTNFYESKKKRITLEEVDDLFLGHMSQLESLGESWLKEFIEPLLEQLIAIYRDFSARVVGYFDKFCAELGSTTNAEQVSKIFFGCMELLIVEMEKRMTELMRESMSSSADLFAEVRILREVWNHERNNSLGTKISTLNNKEFKKCIKKVERLFLTYRNNSLSLLRNLSPREDLIKFYSAVLHLVIATYDFYESEGVEKTTKELLDECEEMSKRRVFLEQEFLEGIIAGRIETASSLGRLFLREGERTFEAFDAARKEQILFNEGGEVLTQRKIFMPTGIYTTLSGVGFTPNPLEFVEDVKPLVAVPVPPPPQPKQRKKKNKEAPKKVENQINDNSESRKKDDKDITPLSVTPTPPESQLPKGPSYEELLTIVTKLQVEKAKLQNNFIEVEKKNQKLEQKYKEVVQLAHLQNQQTKLLKSFYDKQVAKLCRELDQLKGIVK